MAEFGAALPAARRRSACGPLLTSVRALPPGWRRSAAAPRPSPQWRKRRTPVVISAMSCSTHAASTSSSRLDPSGSAM